MLLKGYDDLKGRGRCIDGRRTEHRAAIAIIIATCSSVAVAISGIAQGVQLKTTIAHEGVFPKGVMNTPLWVIC